MIYLYGMGNQAIHSVPVGHQQAVEQTCQVKILKLQHHAATLINRQGTEHFLQHQPRIQPAQSPA